MIEHWRLLSSWLSRRADMASIQIVSGHHPDPVRQDYDYAARTRSLSVVQFSRCIANMRRQRIASILDGESRVTSKEDLPPSALAVKGGWKKLHAIKDAAKHADIVIWHDSDALPRESGRLIERVRRIVSEQPNVTLWLAPAGEVQKYLNWTSWDAFVGVSLDSVRRRVRTSNDLQTSSC